MSKLISQAAALTALVSVGVLSNWATLLFSFHMVQHLLLIAVVAPLLVLGGARIRMPAIAGWSLFIATFLFWHWPSAFQWAAGSVATEALELGSILATAMCFWSGALILGALSDGARALLVMTAAVITDLPGVIMLFSPRVICEMPNGDAGRFGLTALQDQQIAGLLMWVPANLVFFAIATFLFARWIGAYGMPTNASSPGAAHGPG